MLRCSATGGRRKVAARVIATICKELADDYQELLR